MKIYIDLFKYLIVRIPAVDLSFEVIENETM